jgi:hypothetical protein
VIATADDLILMTERSLLFVNPNLHQILGFLRQLESVDGKGYCWLEDQKRGHVQTPRGENGFHLEWREWSGFNSAQPQHFRAGHKPFSEVPMPLSP